MDKMIKHNSSITTASGRITEIGGFFAGFWSSNLDHACWSCGQISACFVCQGLLFIHMYIYMYACVCVCCMLKCFLYSLLYTSISDAIMYVKSHKDQSCKNTHIHTHTYIYIHAYIYTPQDTTAQVVFEALATSGGGGAGRGGRRGQGRSISE